MSERLGELVCFDEPSRQPVDSNLGWADVERGKHRECGRPVAIQAEAFDAYDIEEQQRICDDGLRWKFHPPTDRDDAFRVKKLSRPWAKGEVLRMINGASRD